MLKRSAFPNRYSFAELSDPTVGGGDALPLFDASHESIEFYAEDPNVQSTALNAFAELGPLHFLNFQNDKYGWFLREGLRKAFADISPIKDATGKLSLHLQYDPDDPDAIGPAKFSEAECLEREITYSRPIFVKAEFRNENTGEIKESVVFMGDIPVMTEYGTFIINGTERVVVSQLVRADGSYTEPEVDPKGNVTFVTTVIPVRGERPKFALEIGESTRVVVRIGKGKKVNAFSVLRALDSRVGFNFLEKFVAHFTTGPKGEVRILEGEFEKYRLKYNEKYDKDLRTYINRGIRTKEWGNKLAKFGNFLIEEKGHGMLDALTVHLELFHDGDQTKYDQAGQEMALIEIYKAWKGLEPSDRWIDIFDIDAWRLPSAPVPGDANTAQKFRSVMESRIEPFFRMIFLDPLKPLLPGQQPRTMDRNRAKAGFELSDLGLLRIERKFQRSNEIAQNRDLFGDVFEPTTGDKRWLSPDEVLATVTYLLNLRLAYLADRTQTTSNPSSYRTDDTDQLSNRRIRSVGELVAIAFRQGLARMERVVRDRMATQDVEAITPTTLINIRPVVAALKEFFATSQLSQFLDQTNPLSSLTHKRRLSALGVGGLTRERAGLEVRDVLASYYGRICPIETPEGPNVGLIGYFANYALLDKYGFIHNPVRLVKNGQVTDDFRWVNFESEPYLKIAAAETEMDAKGKITAERVLIRTGSPGTGIPHHSVPLNRLGSTVAEFALVSPDEVDAIDISPIQNISLSTALIPFVEHDDPQRALMGANMQRQAVPLITPEAPYVGTGLESRAAADSGEVLLAEANGVVTEVSGDKITIEYETAVAIRDQKPNKKKTYKLNKFRRSNQSTAIHQRALVAVGDKVTPGDLLADGTSTANGELALGKNLLVAYMPWEGYNFEDAIIVSERLVRDDVLTSIHIEEHEIDARDTKLGPEEITRDIPNLPEDLLADLDEEGIIRIGAEVSPGDILVGKVAPKGETEQSPEERLLRAIFGEKAREVRDTSLRLPHGEYGTVIDVKVVSRGDDHELQPGVNKLVKVYVAQKRKISEGDKLAGRHGNKGVISKILPEEDMPYMPDGTPVDIILSPLGVPSRMNVGQVLESHLGYAARYGWKGVDASATAGTSGQTDGAYRKTRPRTEPAVYVASPAFDGARWDQDNPRSSKPNIKHLFENLNTDGADGRRMTSANNDGKVTLYNGRTGEPYDNPIAVGYAYILKLAHMVDDKIHARSTGPYTLVTQQPIGGKAQFGGQRFGEMEVWALEAYGAAHALQELITVKSDDTKGRERAYEAIVKGENLPTPGVPESFKALVKEMQALCLNVEVRQGNGVAVQLADTEEDFFSPTRELGINISRNEHGSDEEDARRLAERNTLR